MFGGSLSLLPPSNEYLKNRWRTMPETYTGARDDKRYTGQDIDVTFNLQRCIHSAECLRRLPWVFDRGKRPWVNPAGADANAITKVVLRCPSGALHVERKDSGQGEELSPENVVYLKPNSHLRIVGNLSIQASGVDIVEESRVTLCRCGGSQNKPFCDNTHRTNGFQAPDPAPAEGVDGLQFDSGGVLHIRARPNGPLELRGNFEIRNQVGELVYRGSRITLCRCGGSSDKPFCDSTHHQNGFNSP
jgi:CDGSH-type Zn-finger protein/uncharacterized Fe-S cluster protein YjdI